MNLITLTTDYGNGSHYVSVLKGKIYSLLPESSVVDVTDKHNPYDLIESAYIFNLIRSNFPPRTIHLFLVNSMDAHQGRLLLAYDHHHYYILPDNGAVSLLFGAYEPDIFQYFRTMNSGTDDWYIASEAVSDFIHSGLETDQKFKKFDDYQRKSAAQPVMNDNNLTGTIMFNDSLGHAHTNISEELIRTFTKNNRFRILLSRHEWVETIQNNLADIKEGEPYASFNHGNFLYIGVKKGKSSQLMNLTKSRPIRIELI